MYVSNEEWEQNNQDYLKELYEETGFTTGGYAIRKLICGGCGRVFYTTIYTKKYCQPAAAQSNLPLSTMTPPSDVPCPPINFVAECITTSAPYSMGRSR